MCKPCIVFISNLFSLAYNTRFFDNARYSVITILNAIYHIGLLNMFTYLKTKLSPYYEFWILNALLATLIGARYFLYFPEVPFDGVQFSFAVTSLFSHMSLLALVFWLVGLVLCFLPFKAKRIILALLATIALTFLFIDTMVFGFYRFHLNYPVLSLVMSGQIVEFPASAWAMLTAGLAVFFGFQWWALSKMEVGMIYY